MAAVSTTSPAILIYTTAWLSRSLPLIYDSNRTLYYGFNLGCELKYFPGFGYNPSLFAGILEDEI